MQTDWYTKTVLTTIAAILAILALQFFSQPAAVRAQADDPDLYIEPGYTLLRNPDGSSQLKGKMVVNLKTGDIWGFPTLVDGPYPVDATKNAPPVSEPMYLGKFDFSAMAARP